MLRSRGVQIAALQLQRRTIIMGPLYSFAKKIMPKISNTVLPSSPASLTAGQVGRVTYSRDAFA